MITVIRCEVSPDADEFIQLWVEFVIVNSGIRMLITLNFKAADGVQLRDGRLNMMKGNNMTKLLEPPGAKTGRDTVKTRE